MNVLKVSCIQSLPKEGDFDKWFMGSEIDHACNLAREAAQNGPHIIVFHELYPLVGEEELCSLAKDLKIHIIAGQAERKNNTKWYNTSAVFSPEGRIVARQRKCFPTQAELDMGVVPGNDYDLITLNIDRVGQIKIGIVICSDFAFFAKGITELVSKGVDLIFNPSLWFAIAEAYPSTVIERHLEYGVPVIGIDTAKYSFNKDYPPAGGYSTVCIPPSCENLEELDAWFKRDPKQINSMKGFVHTLGEEEGRIDIEIDIEKTRKFPGYFYIQDNPRKIK